MTIMWQLIVLHIEVVLLLVHAQVMLHMILATSLLFLHVHLFDELVFGLW